MSVKLPKPDNDAVYLAIRQCGLHGYRSISVETNTSGGTRLTSTKCCGRWDLVQRWKIDPEQVVKEIRDEAR